MNETMIDLGQYFQTGTVSGRDTGNDLREKCGVDAGTSESSITIVVPDKVHTITASFLGGLLGVVMMAAPSQEALHTRVKFDVKGDHAEMRKLTFESTMTREYIRVVNSGKSLFS